ncbi:MAG: hypothetical protein AAF202_04130, partial [Pseudomonadota bacterium]
MAAPAEEANEPEEVFSGLITPGTLQAEQQWVAEAPRTWEVRALKAVAGLAARWFAPREMEGMMERHGDLPEIYWPESQQVFDLPIFHLSPGLVHEIGTRPMNAKKALWAVHPHTLTDYGETPDEIREWLKKNRRKIKKESSAVKASPSSSNRSLFGAILDPETGLLTYRVFKTSSHLWTSGSDRRISRTQAVRAVVVSKIYEQAYQDSKGQLPLSGGNWTFFPETYASIPKDLGRAAFVLRGQPLGEFAGYDFIPAYSVNVRMPNKKKWIDDFFEIEDDIEMRETVWEKIIGPAWELMLQMTFLQGARPELHGQNLIFVVKPKTKKFIGIAFRDASSMVSQTLRSANGLSNDFDLPDWVTQEDLGVEKSRGEIESAIGYFDEYLMDMVFGLRFDSDDMRYFRSQQNKMLRDFANLHKQQLGSTDASSKSKFINSVLKRIKFHDQVSNELSANASTTEVGKQAENNAVDSSEQLSGEPTDNGDQPSHLEYTTQSGKPRAGVKSLESPYSNVGELVQGESLTASAGEVRYYPQPILLPKDEVELLRKASEQRLRTLRAFVDDVRSGKNTWTEIIPEPVLIALNRGRELNGQAWPEYRPYGGVDYVRQAQTGEFLSMETQVSPIPAGTAYVDAMLSTYKKYYPDFKEKDGIFAPLQRAIQGRAKKRPVTVLLDYNVVGPANMVSSTAAQNLFLNKRNADRLREEGIYLVTVDHFDQFQRSIENCTGLCLSAVNNRANFEFADGTSTRIRIDNDKLLLDLIKRGEVVETLSVDYLWNHIDPTQMSQLADEILPLVNSGKLRTNYHPAL